MIKEQIHYINYDLPNYIDFLKNNLNCPILIERYENGRRLCYGTPIIIRAHNSSNPYDVMLTIRPFWEIRGTNLYCVDGLWYYNLEQFFDNLKRNYPQHVEMFIWHPELLS